MTDRNEDFAAKIGNGRDPLTEKLDLVLEEVTETRELIEEVLEKISELELPYNSGFQTYD